MTNRFTLFKRGNVYYCEDRTTGQQKSLQTCDESEAQRILQAKNDTVKLPQMNMVMAKTYLSAQDPKMIARTMSSRDSGLGGGCRSRCTAFLKSR